MSDFVAQIANLRRAFAANPEHAKRGKLFYKLRKS